MPVPAEVGMHAGLAIPIPGFIAQVFKLVLSYLFLKWRPEDPNPDLRRRGQGAVTGPMSRLRGHSVLMWHGLSRPSDASGRAAPRIVGAGRQCGRRVPPFGIGGDHRRSGQQVGSHRSLCKGFVRIHCLVNTSALMAPVCPTWRPSASFVSPPHADHSRR